MSTGRKFHHNVVVRLWALCLLVFVAFFSTAATILLLVRPAMVGPGGFPWQLLVIALAGAVLLAGIEFVVFRMRDLYAMRHLREATREVAKGNFDVRLPQDRGFRRTKLVQEFNKMTIELNKLETFRSDFINNVSHEFKTPTASIYGYAKVLADSGLTPRQQTLADVIVQESERLSKLTSSILRLSKLENLDMIRNCVNFQLDEQLRSVVLSMSKKSQAKNLHINVTFQNIQFLGDQDLMYHVWQNILDNAIKYSFEGGKISMSCYKQNTEIVVCIKDYGAGMDEEAVSRLFEKFYQGDATRSSEGNGLGLAIAKRVVELSGGDIEVASEPGKGTAFTVRLPAVGALYRL